jgi:hypothetical protein
MAKVSFITRNADDAGRGRVPSTGEPSPLFSVDESPRRCDQGPAFRLACMPPDLPVVVFAPLTSTRSCLTSSGVQDAGMATPFPQTDHLRSSLSLSRNLLRVPSAFIRCTIRAIRRLPSWPPAVPVRSAGRRGSRLHD